VGQCCLKTIFNVFSRLEDISNVISVPQTTSTWIFKKCAKVAKNFFFFHDTKPPIHVTKPLMTENGKNAKTGAGLYGVLGVGQCFGLLGVGRFCTGVLGVGRFVRSVGRGSVLY
jgi:hypothetical protein